MMWAAVGTLCTLVRLATLAQAMPERERLELRLEAEDMFLHAYNAYMEVAWPADELMPLSCRGRYRGREPDRGDIDDALGNFSLTLVDSLDMLLVIGRVDLFEQAVLKVVESVTFDTDVVVSVFETNIRMVGGLVSGHVLAEYVRDNYSQMSWYRGQLLNMALDVATRLLPAFNSTTGLPYPRVNLRTGLKGVDPLQLTCTACAGSMILEFAALSRLSGEKVFEEKASKAMDYLWAARHRQSNLVGNVLNVNTGDWVRRESGVGAGIDSYYEYVAKAYVLLGEDKYLDRWNTHYSAIMKYLNTGPLMSDVHMHRPTTSSKHFTDALGAFWPGLQVLMGDLKPAIEQHEILYQITKKHHFLPEAITSDFQVHWGQHFLRPEFVESTYFLYKATKDPHYLEVGKKVLKALQKHARVTCGYAAVKDVRTTKHEDRMDSFVLSETFKYLYLLFSKDNELFLDMDQFVFTTEAHLLPLTLARLSNSTVVPVQDDFFDFFDSDEDVEFAQSCPSTRYLFPKHASTVEAAASLREPLGNVVEDANPRQLSAKRRILAADFHSNNPEHINLVKEMGISIMSLPDGRVQLLHSFANARTQEDAEEGLIFMHEMIEIAKQNQPSDSPPKQVRYSVGGKEVVLQAGPAQFGPGLKPGTQVFGKLVKANEPTACMGGKQSGDSMWGNIVLVDRGNCMFIEKARVLQTLGAKGGIVLDNTEGTAAASSPIFAMSGDGSEDVTIPMVFLFNQEAKQLIKALEENTNLEVALEEKPFSQESDYVSTAPDDKEDQILDKIRSPVHAFLQQSINVDPQEPGDEYISVQRDQNTGDIISERIRTIRNQDGTSKTFKTVEKIKNGEVETLRSVGEVKILKLDREGLVKVKAPPKEVPSEELIPQIFASLANMEVDLQTFQGKVLKEEDDVIELLEEEFLEDSDSQTQTKEDYSNMDHLSASSNQEIENRGSTNEVGANHRSTNEDATHHGSTNEDAVNREMTNQVRDVLLASLRDPASELEIPEVLSHLLDVSFSELLAAANQIYQQTSSNEQTIRLLLKWVSRKDRDLAQLSTISEDVEKSAEPSEILISQILNKYLDKGSQSDIVKMLGEAKIAELMAEYLGTVENEKEKR